MKTLGLLSQRRKVIASIEDVVAWLKDHHVVANLKPPVLTAFEWPGKVSIREAEQIHSFGKWYRFELRKPQPAPIAGTDTTSSTKYSHPWADYRRCIHSTSLYVLPSILHQGLLPGKHPGKGGVRGVYCYEMITQSLAVKSSQYCVYASPQNDGVFWGPRLEIQVAVGCAMHHAKSISVGGRQYAAFEGSYTMTALWVHLITQDELRLALQEAVRLWYYIDAWRPEFLVPRDVEQ
jgi:drug/metabolite transporter superfamily protein YnfA